MHYSSSGDSMSEDNDPERHLRHLADRTMLELERASLQRTYPDLDIPFYEEGMTDMEIRSITLGLATARVLQHDIRMASNEQLLVNIFELWYRSLALNGRTDVVDRMYRGLYGQYTVGQYAAEYAQGHGSCDEVLSFICASIRCELESGRELYFSSMSPEDLLAEMESYRTAIEVSEGRSTCTFEDVPRQLWNEIGRRLMG